MLQKASMLLLLISSFLIFASNLDAELQNDLLPYTGAYRLGTANHLAISIRRMGPRFVLVLTDFRTDAFRVLFPTKEKDAFVVGKELIQPEPVESRVIFERDGKGNVRSIQLKDVADDYVFSAEKVIHHVHPIEIRNGSILLKGNLFLPDTKAPYPAVVLAHASEDNDRYSFDALPHILSAIGIAVIVYDKRGTGESNGSWQDSGLQELSDDLLAAVHLLKKRKDINGQKIGIIGFSEGGWVAPLAAKRDSSISFIVSISGGVLKKSETFLYKYKQQFEEQGLSGQAFEQAMAEKRAIISESEERVRTGNKPTGFDLRISYDPTADWNSFQNPVLYLGGSYDVLEPAEESAARLKHLLSRNRNRDFTIKLFPQTNHAMLLAKTNKPSEFQTMKGVSQFAPGYWDTLLRWLQLRLATQRS